MGISSGSLKKTNGRSHTCILNHQIFAQQSKEIKREVSTYLPYEVWWDSFPTEEQLGSQRGTKKSSQEVAETLEAANQPKKIAQTLTNENRGSRKKSCTCKSTKENNYDIHHAE